MKKLVLILDGTMQSFTSGNNLISLARNIETSPTQLVYYDSGIATLGSLWRRLFDGATGHGLMKNLKEAYTFLMHNYQEGDKIYMIGYSRGAATIRLLVDLISRIGLLPGYLDHLLPNALEAFQTNDEEALSVLADLSPEEAPYVTHIELYDTCFGGPITTRLYRRILSASWSNVVTSLRHHIAEDEERIAFCPFRWDNHICCPTYKEFLHPETHSSIAYSPTIYLSLALLLYENEISMKKLTLWDASLEGYKTSRKKSLLYWLQLRKHRSMLGGQNKTD